MFAADVRLPYCLEGVAIESPALSGTASGVAVTIQIGAKVQRIMPFAATNQAVEAALSGLGLPALPNPGAFSPEGDARLDWAGKNCWHLVTGADVDFDLAQALAGLAAVSDASDGLLCLGINGPQAVALLSKGCVLDLDGFQPGQCATTLMAHTRLQILRHSLSSFELMVPASYAASFWEWLSLSAAEFGMTVEISSH